MTHPNPIDVFNEWYSVALANGSPRPAAMCLGTVNADGRPNARMVDLKTIYGDGFVFTTNADSPKSVDIRANAAVTLTFWWPVPGRQIRVSGNASRIPDQDADTLFVARSRDAQIASWAFVQSDVLPPGVTTDMLYKKAAEQFGSAPVPRPADWIGYLVTPNSVEFLEFDVSRAHRRVRYQRSGAQWSVSELQP